MTVRKKCRTYAWVQNGKMAVVRKILPAQELRIRPQLVCLPRWLHLNLRSVLFPNMPSAGQQRLPYCSYAVLPCWRGGVWVLRGDVSDIRALHLSKERRTRHHNCTPIMIWKIGTDCGKAGARALKRVWGRYEVICIELENSGRWLRLRWFFF